MAVLLETEGADPIFAKAKAREQQEYTILIGKQKDPTEVESELGETVTSPEEVVDQPSDSDADMKTDAEALVDDELADMEKALGAAEQELVLHKDAMLRMQAEMENLRKRLTRDLEKSRKFALERVMKDLLQVNDTLERGLDMTDESTSVESLLEGKKLTLKMLNKVMTDHGLEVIDPVSETFNPDFHEAVTVVPNPELEENTIVEVLQKGFKLHDRLIRPAMVVVSGKT